MPEKPQKPTVRPEPHVPKARATEPIGACQWCGEPAYTRLYVNGPKARHKIFAEVCDEHARRFAATGGVTEAMEFQRKFGVEGIGPSAINRSKT